MYILDSFGLFVIRIIKLLNYYILESLEMSDYSKY